MELTGKCKEEFEGYLNKLRKHETERKFADIDMIIESQGYDFDDLPDSMKYGVLVDYFDSVDLPITIGVYTIRINEAKDWCFQIVGNKHSNQNKLISFERFYNKRPEARSAAIEKANELRNEVLNK